VERIQAGDLLGSSTEVIGGQSSGADCLSSHWAAGQVVVLNRPMTLAEGWRWRTPDPEAFDSIRAACPLVSFGTDKEICVAIRGLLDGYAIIWWRARRGTTAALLRRGSDGGEAGRDWLVSGGNIDLDVLRRGLSD